MIRNLYADLDTDQAAQINADPDTYPNPQHWLQKVKSLIVPFFAQLPVLRAQTAITLAAGFGCAVDAVELRAQSSSLGFTRAEII